MSMTLAILAVATLVSGPDVLLADFESDSYGAWTVTGEAFGPSPARGTLPGQMRVAGFQGRGLVNSYRGGDQSTGRLTSPEFTISRRAVSFLIGGGGWAGTTCMNLLVDAKVVRTATGPNTEPGGSEYLEPMSWNVTEFAGKAARLEIVDAAAGGWGHINVDHIVLTDQQPPGPVEHPSRTFLIDRQYLNLPIASDAPVRRLTLVVDGTVVNDFEAAITERTPDFWAFVDVSRWRGKHADLRAQRLPAGGAALDKAELSDSLRADEPLYAEKLRPQFHFTTRRGWINDPNGLVFAGGEYHLYYQHNPFGWTSRNMHWGHAVSRDLVRWTELPAALAPHRFGDWVWSGSAVVDAANTAGWKTTGDDVIVAAFTSTARGECVVYSTDRGRTFTEFQGNPVVTHQHGEGRDPRLFRFGPANGGHWVMAVYDEDRGAPEPDRRGVAFYTSPDLKQWTCRSRTGGFYECPDVFELPVDGGAHGTRWVLTAADSNYLLGQFDGETFTPDAPATKLQGNRSDRFYAAQTFSQTPDGRRIQIGWGRIDTPGMPFNQMMSFPCELTLRTTPDGVRMFAWPVREVESLHGRSWKMAGSDLGPGAPLVTPVTGELLDLTAVLEPGRAASVEMTIRGMPLVLDFARATLACGGQSCSLPVRDGRVPVRVLVDRTSVEIFVNEGEIAMLVAGVFGGGGVAIGARGGPARLLEFEAHEVRPAWASP